MSDQLREKFISTGEIILNGGSVRQNSSSLPELATPPEKVKTDASLHKTADKKSDVPVFNGKYKKSKSFPWLISLLFLFGGGYYIYRPEKAIKEPISVSSTLDKSSAQSVPSNVKDNHPEKNQEQLIIEEEKILNANVFSSESKDASSVDKLSKSKLSPPAINPYSDAEIRAILYGSSSLESRDSRVPDFINRFEFQKGESSLLAVSSTSIDGSLERNLGLVFFLKSKKDGDEWRVLGKNSKLFSIAHFSHVVPTNGIVGVIDSGNELTFSVDIGNFVLDADGYHRVKSGSDFESRRRFYFVTLNISDGRVIARDSNIFIDTKFPYKISELSLDGESGIIIVSGNERMYSKRLFVLNNLGREFCALNYNTNSQVLLNDTCKSKGVHLD